VTVPTRSTTYPSALALVVFALGVTPLLLWGRQLPLEYATGDPPVGVRGRYPADRLALADVAGARENYSAIDDLAGVAALNILTPGELTALRGAGARRAKVGVWNYQGGKATIVLVAVADAGAARAAAGQLAALQRGYGFRRIPAPGGVEAGLLGPGSGAVPGGRAHYVHDDIVARVEFRAEDSRVAHQEFGALLERQLEVLAADDG
jgi:hypothetical protein